MDGYVVRGGAAAPAARLQDASQPQADVEQDGPDGEIDHDEQAEDDVEAVQILTKGLIMTKGLIYVKRTAAISHPWCNIQKFTTILSLFIVVLYVA